MAYVGKFIIVEFYSIRSSESDADKFYEFLNKQHPNI